MPVSVIRIRFMESRHGRGGKRDDRSIHRLHHREQVMSTGDTGPRLAELFAFVEPEDTLFALKARRVLAAKELPGTPPTSDR